MGRPRRRVKKEDGEPAPRRPAAQADEPPAVQANDELPATRVARAAELGLLGASLFGNIVRAGARGLIDGLGGKERVWAEAHRAGAAVLFSSLGRLRGPATKIGQFLAQRPGTLPDEYLEEMLKLADRVPPMSAAIVEAQILDELGRMPSAVFESFDRRPLAAGSLGQVHAATIAGGTKVAVKVQYPGVEEALQADLANLASVTSALERLVNRADLHALVAEIRDRLTEELDYELEAERYTLFRDIFEAEPILVPAVHPLHSTKRVLTVDLVEGWSLPDFLARRPSQEQRNRAASLLLRFSHLALFEHGVLHVDPNPGNYLFREDGSFGVVDFGCVKRFSPGFPARLEDLYRAAADGGDAALDEVLVASGMCVSSATPAQRARMRDLTRMWTRPGTEPDFDFGDRTYLDELTHLQHRLARDPAAALPPEWVFYTRQVIGVSYLLYRLGARHRSLFVDQFRALLDRPAARKKPAGRKQAGGKPAGGKKQAAGVRS